MGAAQAGGQESGPFAALRIASAARSGADLLGEYVKACKGKRPLRRILIASNGMAATKCMMSLRQWAYMESGLDKVFEFVAMATKDDLDANAEFIRLADVYVEVPPGKNVNNYANVDLICKIAVEQQVDAVWPGWGHASENPRLPEKLKELGIVFVGPTSSVMSALGDKIAAGILAQTAGVPSIPWSGDGLTCALTKDGTVPDEVFRKATLHSVEEAIKCAERIGYPTVLKASEGGGGKGIRMSNSKEELEQHFVQVQNEVPGSPVFMMQLCTGARHIEVQIVGDEHGNVVALSGRDCSTQRRFQKIFEEGPPAVVPKDRFREMERAAQRLTQSIGYMGAGTIEYLYNVQTDQFYFLELNPRLQVEHPVTEAITGVNMPATQLQVAMGIPLQNMPQIRKFYGKAETDDYTPISFMTDDYVYPTVHCIASRITAENPDDGFKPTSGKIERVRFQSSVSCWGYFSVSTHAAIHEFADSQFGHIFARGKDREEARKTLQLALRNVEVVGDIRTPVDYLVELLNTKAFINNSIDTSWLDGLIKAKSVKVQYSQSDVVFFAAVFKALQAAKAKDEELLDALARRRLGLLGQVKGLNLFQVEITFEGTRYVFAVQRSSSDLFVFSIGAARITTQVRVQADKSLLVGVGNSVTKVFGTEEPLGLRLRLQGIGTIMLPTIYDPSELRSEFNGKVIRYLHADGAVVTAGEAYVELEAMKMIMPLKAAASGKICHLKGAGSIVSAGEMLGRLTLADPSSVQTILPFEGIFEISAGTSGATVGGDALSRVLLVLDGYAPLAAPAKLAEELLATGSEEDRTNAATSVIDRYLEVERSFAALSSLGQSKDLICGALIEANKDNPEAVCTMLRAHSQLGARNEAVLAVLKQAGPLAAAQSPEASVLAGRLQALMVLPPDNGYGEVLLLARRLAEGLGQKPFEERLEALRATIEGLPADGIGKLSTAEAATAGTDLLAALLEKSSELVRTRALEVYVRRTYRGFGVSKDSKMQVLQEECGRLAARWRFRHPGVSVDSKAGMAVWLGCCVLLPDLASLQDLLVNPLTMSKDSSSGPSGPGRLQLVLSSKALQELAQAEAEACGFDAAVERLQPMLKAAAKAFTAAAVREVVTMAPGVSYASFTESLGWAEDRLRRNLPPTAPCLLELGRLWEEYELERLIPAEAGGTQVFLGPKRDDPRSPQAKPGRARGGKMQTVFARMFSHAPIFSKSGDDGWAKPLEGLLFSALHEIECVCLNPKVQQGRSDSRIFLSLTALVDVDAAEMTARLERFLAKFTSKHGAPLQRLWVDEIVVKVRLGGESGSNTSQATLRFTASSMAGEYMKTVALLEQVDALTGNPVRWVELGSNKELEPPVVANGTIQTRRIAARRANSTYAPEFLGLLRAALVKQWAAHARLTGGKPQVPFDMFRSTELVDGTEGELVDADRAPGSNTIGMLAWRCVLKTPEYPEGRTIVLIANDVTHQAGSFGVAEDAFFKRATEYARRRGLPRIYLACNSGARVGLVDELMTQIQVKWTDPNDPARGFDYLYITKDAYDRLPAGAVVAHEVAAPDGGPPHMALDAVVGEGLSSTHGGIGVENLQGSGLIAGETSRAYNEIFTLSYVTGRSVGIGAYLNRLGHRTIQSVDGPMVLTGFSALNKLLGREVYSSQDQLGGPQVMVHNGVTHQLVQNDQEGAEAICNWLSFVPRDAKSPPPALPPHDPIGRAIDFVPTKQPYDPRHMLAGFTSAEGLRVSGFFDDGTFKEYLAGWGRSVVVGRARLGGIPMGVIAVETRNVERRIPADPGNPESREVLEPQAGQVWYPDSAYKTATAIRDFNRGENLPLIIFANWRGFSGGTRDMFGEVLKFGAQIVDALVEYKQPVFIYIPPGGELRGGSWVVIDPAINPGVMEMYADVESRGGILEPSGVVEVKFRKPQRAELMHRLDPKLAALDAQLAAAAPGCAAGIKEEIAAREAQLEPLYTQVACEFADLHDRVGRMKATGAIREALRWRNAREFFYWRLRRRLGELRLARDVQAADPTLSADGAQSLVAGWLPAGCADREAVEVLERQAMHKEVRRVHAASLRRRIAELRAELGEDGEATPSKAVSLREVQPAPGGCLTRCLRALGGNPAAHDAAPAASVGTRRSGQESPSGRALGRREAGETGKVAAAAVPGAGISV